MLTHNDALRIVDARFVDGKVRCELNSALIKVGVIAWFLATSYINADERQVDPCPRRKRESTMKLVCTNHTNLVQQLWIDIKITSQLISSALCIKRFRKLRDTSEYVVTLIWPHELLWQNRNHFRTSWRIWFPRFEWSRDMHLYLNPVSFLVYKSDKPHYARTREWIASNCSSSLTSGKQWTISVEIPLSCTCTRVRNLRDDMRWLLDAN
jgi:hypothetical protein